MGGAAPRRVRGAHVRERWSTAVPKPNAAEGIPARQVITDPDSLGRYAHDEAEWAPRGVPARRRAPPGHRRGAGRRRVLRRAPDPGRPARRRNGSVGRRQRGGRRRRPLLRGHEPDPAHRPGGAPRRRPARRRQRRSARRLRRAGPLVPAGPGELALVHDRRQRRHQRGRHVLRQVRRDPRLRARAGGGQRPRGDRAGGPADREGRRRVRPLRPPRRLRGHPRRDHRDHREAAAAPDPPSARWPASSTPSSPPATR